MANFVSFEMISLIIAAVVIADVHSVSVYDVVMDEWRYYKTNTRRHFRSSEEEYNGLKTFLESKDLVARHNERYAKGLEDYRVALNRFADWSPFETADGEEEVSSRFMSEMKEMHLRSPSHEIVVPGKVNIPDKVNWTEAGAVTEVVDQETCGSCYAITSAAAMEAQVFIKHHVLSRLSFQQILDCSREFGNTACDGGTFGNTFNYLEKTGLTSYSLYPYEKEAGKCRLNNRTVSDTVKNVYYMYDGDEEKLKYAVAHYGPVAVGINASPKTFQLYAGGVYADKKCDLTLVHAVLLVGYGTDQKTNKDYWLIKNSWGTSWGENGYVRLARNADNMCGIGALAYVAKLD